MNRETSHSGPLSPEFALLGLLQEGPSHGYELFQILSTELGQVWHISLSQAYNILNRLESQGFISAEMLPQEKLPARRLFRLTASGRQRFERWLGETSLTSVRLIRLEFLTRLYFARAREAAFANDLIDTQISEVHKGLERLQIVQSELPENQTINRLSIDLRRRQLESILPWLESCRQEILEQELNSTLEDEKN